MARVDRLGAMAEFDEGAAAPGEEIEDAIDGLLADLGVADDTESHLEGAWALRLGSAADAGPGALLARLGHPDRGLRRIVPLALAYVWLPEVWPRLYALADEQDDEPTALGLHIAATRWEPDRRGRLGGSWPAATRFATAFGLVLRPPFPGQVRRLGAPKEGAQFRADVLDALLLVAREEVGGQFRRLAWAHPEWASPVGEVQFILERHPDLEIRWLAGMLAGGSLNERDLADLRQRASEVIRARPERAEALRALLT